MRVIQLVHRQPRCEGTMNPPIIGPAMGPKKVAAQKPAAAIPRSTGSQRSTKAPPTTARVTEPKAPIKNRQMRIVARFCATATGIWNMAEMVKQTSIGSRRPYTSERGPQIIGPRANPFSIPLVWV
ncbi:hypothetical protein H113_04053 [Trichophyton rubrum MR1459]|uniref:Uncharacterized protein n=1 Tax=Trichophyton rubrum (strain ATCC MYA-4607 / CBS 118892) TaxID=559305 RepID=A0A080WNR3_TRIRC|nr:uncharacterized protein TERG_12270 [Trichophyton rubrum CBS 118892]EZF95606.1 hypothetical protein H113_04053 [Trichophyton rubrum MR1459]KFL61925.1 hypothetical protein TERG_12270 [Trichophyton rubrum CBS 118892]